MTLIGYMYYTSCPGWATKGAEPVCRLAW